MHRRIHRKRPEEEGLVFHRFPKQPIIVNLAEVNPKTTKFPGSDWLEGKLKTKQAVGWDVEWPPDGRTQAENPVALMQFADADTALLVRTHRTGQWLPSVIREVLTSETCTKVCVGYDSAAKHKMRMSFDLQPAGLLDLATLAAQKGLEEADLKSLAEHFQYRVRKDARVGRSSWAQPELTAEQQAYAADDVYFAFLLKEKLEELPDKEDKANSSAVEGQLRLQEGWVEHGIEKRHDGLRCRLCNSGPMATPDHVRKHMLGSDHLKRIRARLGMEQGASDTLTDEQEHNHIYEGDGLNGVEKGQFGCYLCGTKTLQNLQAVATHINSPGHQEAMKTEAGKLREGPFERLWNLPDYVILEGDELNCTLCQSLASRVDEMYLHLHGKRHSIRVRALEHEDIIWIREKNQLVYTQTGEIVVRKNFVVPREPSGGAPALPEGWASNLDPTSGRTYYWRVDQPNQSQWEHPGKVSSSTTGSVKQDGYKKCCNELGPLPDDWEEHEADDGRVFYYCLRTLRSQWLRPTIASPMVDSVRGQEAPTLHKQERHATSAPLRETSSHPVACSEPQKLAPGWDVYRNERGQAFFWDAENQVSSGSPPEPYHYQSAKWVLLTDSRGAYWQCSMEGLPSVSFYESDTTWHRRQDGQGRIYWSNPVRHIRFFEPDRA